ncbi:MAG: Ig-like domain-containing protein [Chloroflexi bacterium]|nr:Ig-like domain-containing protein [Chloroflexota bacterium]
MPAGPHTLTAVATDNAGAKTTSGAVNITVNAPNNPPTASVISPTDSVILQAPASITLEATAADTDGSISQVAFYRVILMGGPAVTRELLGTAAASPYRISLNNVQAGFYHLLAEATDNLGAKTDSREIVVTVYAPFRIISAVRSSDGQVTLTVEGNAAMGPFTALASEDAVNWTNLPGPLLAQPDNTMRYVDTSAPDAARRFYRVRLDFQEPAPVSAGN